MGSESEATLPASCASVTEDEQLKLQWCQYI